LTDNTFADIGKRTGGEIGKRRCVAADNEPELAECCTILNISIESLEIGGGARSRLDRGSCRLGERSEKEC